MVYPVFLCLLFFLTQISNYFSNQNKEILLDNHKLNLIYEDKVLLGDGVGDLYLENKTNKIKYTFKKDQNNFEFAKKWMLVIQKFRFI